MYSEENSGCGSNLTTLDLFTEPSAQFVSLIHTNKELLLQSLMWFDVVG